MFRVEQFLTLKPCSDRFQEMKKSPPAIKFICSYSKMAKTSSLKQHPKNPNRHSKEQIALLAKVIEGHGWRAPIVVSKLSGFITRGHGRFMAGELLGLKSLPVDLQDYENENQEIADMVADNKLAELSNVDKDELKKLMIELNNADYALELTGFIDKELESILSGTVKDLALNPSENNGVTNSDPEGMSMASHVRMVQLFLNIETFPLFMEAVEKLQKIHKTEDTTSTVFKVVCDAANLHKK